MIGVLEWRLEEVQRINAELTGSERKTALCVLLDETSWRVECIGKQKAKAKKYNKVKNVEYFLKMVRLCLLSNNFMLITKRVLQVLHGVMNDNIYLLTIW